jgi:hypothetical protein
VSHLPWWTCYWVGQYPHPVSHLASLQPPLCSRPACSAVFACFRRTSGCTCPAPPESLRATFHRLIAVRCSVAGIAGSRPCRAGAHLLYPVVLCILNRRGLLQCLTPLAVRTRRSCSVCRRSASQAGTSPPPLLCHRRRCGSAPWPRLQIPSYCEQIPVRWLTSRLRCCLQRKRRGDDVANGGTQGGGIVEEKVRRAMCSRFPLGILSPQVLTRWDSQDMCALQLWKALAKRLDGDLECQLATPAAAEGHSPVQDASPPAQEGDTFRLFRHIQGRAAGWCCPWLVRWCPPKMFTPMRAVRPSYLVVYILQESTAWGAGTAASSQGNSQWGFVAGHRGSAARQRCAATDQEAAGEAGGQGAPAAAEGGKAGGGRGTGRTKAAATAAC